jgi:hypothetical protein
MRSRRTDKKKKDVFQRMRILLSSYRLGMAFGVEPNTSFFCPLELFYCFKGKYKKELNSRFHIYWIKNCAFAVVVPSYYKSENLQALDGTIRRKKRVDSIRRRLHVFP